MIIIIKTLGNTAKRLKESFKFKYTLNVTKYVLFNYNELINLYELIIQKIKIFNQGFNEKSKKIYFFLIKII